MCANAADCLVGTSGASRSERAWRQAYRALEHGLAKSQCEKISSRDFPAEIEDFANQFIVMQSKRHYADYDPWSRFVRSEVLSDIAAVENSIARFKSQHRKDRLAFAVWVVLKKRREHAT